MKYKLFSVLIILAMVASLCAVAVVLPASADVSTSTVTVSNPNAGQASSYAIAFTTGASGTLTADAHDIILTFPAGTTLPSSMDYHNVLVGTPGGTAVNVGTGGVDVNTTNRQVTVNCPINVNGGVAVTVTLTQGAGIVNPALSMEPVSGGDGQGTTGYTLALHTTNTNDAADVASNPYFIYNWIKTDKASAAKGEIITVTGGGFLPGSSINLASTGAAAGGGTVESNGTFSIDAFATGNTLGGLKPVTATDGSGRSAVTGNIGVLPDLTCSPTSGNIGSTVRLNGRNFDIGTADASTPARAPTTVTIGGLNAYSAVIVMADLDSDSVADDFSYAATVPIGLAGGSKVVQVVDKWATGSPVASATFTVSEHAITVDPASGVPGTNIVVTGAGWPPNAGSVGGPVVGQILFAYSPTYPYPINLSVETDGSGAFTETATIPSDATAGLTAIVCSWSSGLATGLAYFTVTSAPLDITPASGPKGTKVVLSGGPMDTSATASVTMGTDSYGTIATDTQGYLTPTTLTIKSTASTGVGAFSVSSGTMSGSAVFEVTKPTITPEQTEAYRGQYITFTGSGWLPGVAGMVTVTCSTNSAMATPDANGNIWAQVQIPTTGVTPGSTVTYSATDSTYSNSTMTGSLPVPNAILTVTPESGVWGDTFTISGTGFLPLFPVTGVMLGTFAIPSQAITDVNGEFSLDITVPGLSAGAYAVQATVGTTASTSFTISTAAAAATTPATGFDTISDCIVIAWSFDAPTQSWVVYDPSAGATSTLEALAANQGLWVQVAEDCTLTFGAFTKDLYQGWNLFGWPS